MSFWDDLSGAFSSLVGDVAAAAGDQESRDALPPPGPKIPLSQRTQRFLNTLLGPMNDAWANMVFFLPDSIKSIAGEGVNPPAYGLRDALDTDVMKNGAKVYLGYSEWVIAYLDAIRGIIGYGFWGQRYTGADYPAILNQLNVTEDDWKGDSSAFDQYVLPQLELARARQNSLIGGLTTALSAPIAPPNPPPVWPLVGTDLAKLPLDKILGNRYGDGPPIGTYAVFLIGTTVVGLAALYYFSNRRR